MQEAAGTLQAHSGTKRLVQAASDKTLPSDTRTKSKPTPKADGRTLGRGSERRTPGAAG